MLLVRPDGDELAALADGFGNRLAAVELALKLIEIGDLEVGAELHRAGVGRELAEQYAQQRTLADAVVADDSDTVAAHHAQREIAQQLSTVVAVRDVVKLDDLAAGHFGRFVDLDSRRAGPFDAFCANCSQLFERSHAALVACPACFDALANPDFFLGQLLVEKGVLSIFLFVTFRPLREVVAVAAGPAAQLAAIDIDDPRRDFLDEAPIVSHEQHGAGIRALRPSPATRSY